MKHVVFLLLFCTTASLALAQTVWNGSPLVFTRAANADPSLAANQDRITTNTWITRGATRGLYIAKTEIGYVDLVSPANTEWATGNLATYSTLTYQPWETWAGGPPNVPNIVGVQAVVHLISENIYIGIKFLSWGVGAGGGGAFSYERTTPGSVVPVRLTEFLATGRTNQVELHWQTASEDNASHFEVERSADGQQYATLGRVAAQGTSQQRQAYQYTDALPQEQNFYRLKLVDRDGRWRYSGIVNYQSKLRGTLQLFPSPATTTLQVQYRSQAASQLRIIHPSGALLHNRPAPAGSHSLAVDIQYLLPGLYFLSVGYDVQRFLKQ